MITKVTSENKGLYKALFEKASNALSLTGDQTIDSLDKYFSVIKTLVDNHGDTYAFLPLDEPTFDINTDTRVIAIPSEFKKNGISVKGDHYAETLFFTINRYFDTTDLYDDHIRIIIQWEAPAQGGGTKKGVSLAVFKDVSVLASQNKMLFGWALTNDITGLSGTVKFSVRFYEVGNDNKLTYSLSTLTTNAIINPGLDYQKENGVWADDIVEYAEDELKLRERLRDSQYVDPTDIPAEATWLVNLPAPTNDVLKKFDLDGNNEYVLNVQATSNQGVVTYNWMWIPTNSSETTELGIGTNTYIATEDTAYSGSKVYYHKDVSNNAYNIISFTPGETIPKGENDLVVYEKVNSLTISHPTSSSPSITGEYYAIANNRVGLGTSRVESNHIIIPGPSALEVSAPVEEINHAYLDSNGTVTLSATATTDAEGDTITYTWGEWYEETGSEGSLINTTSDTIDRNVAKTFTIPAVANESRPTFNTTYGVEIKANRNGDSTATELFKFRVTDHAHAPIVSLTKVGTYVDENHKATLRAEVTNASAIAHDEFSYEWFLYNATDNADSEVFEISGDTAIHSPIISSETSNTIEVGAGGNYYCKVKTIVNDDESAEWVPSQESQLLSLQNRS